MVIHSVMPANNLFPPPEGEARRCIPFARGYLEGTCRSDGSFCIQRVISTDPAAYLDSSCAPGRTIPRGAVPNQWEELT